MSLLRMTQFTGAPPNVSIAYTTNAEPVDLYRCSRQDTVQVPVEPGETILLRIINSALEQELFFSIANLRLTVVSTDAISMKESKDERRNFGDTVSGPDSSPGLQIGDALRMQMQVQKRLHEH